MPSSSSRRFIFIDVLRSLAIALALLAHALNDFDVPGRLSEAEYVALRGLTRAAAPTFIFLFGMMLELVYARRARSNGLATVVPHLLWRSLQCYAGYLATVCAGVLFGLFGWTHALQAAVFIFGAHHGNILKYYTVALVVAVPLLAARQRLGLKRTLALCVGIWLLSPLLNGIAALPVGRFGGLLSLLTQMLPYSLTFIGAGMWVGNSLRRGASLSRSVHTHAGLVLIACASVGGVLIWMMGPQTVLFSYLDYYAFRNSYHVGYYAIGLLQATGLCLLFFHLFPLHHSVLRPTSPLLAFGRSSLLSFTLGNIVLNGLVGRLTLTPHGGLLLTLGYLAFVLGLVLLFERVLGYLRSHPRLAVAERPFTLLRHHLIGPASAALVFTGRVSLQRLGHLLPASAAGPRTEAKTADGVSQG
ncbi:MAG: OpgC domain-containing protein [Salinibacter sp.]